MIYLHLVCLELLFFLIPVLFDFFLCFGAGVFYSLCSICVGYGVRSRGGYVCVSAGIHSLAIAQLAMSLILWMMEHLYLSEQSSGLPSPPVVLVSGVHVRGDRMANLQQRLDSC